MAVNAKDPPEKPLALELEPLDKVADGVAPAGPTKFVVDTRGKKEDRRSGLDRRKELRFEPDRRSGKDRRPRKGWEPGKNL